MQECLREISFLAAQWEFEIRALHIPGVQNDIPDMLSRWEWKPEFLREFLEETKEMVLKEFVVEKDMFASHKLVRVDVAELVRELGREMHATQKAAKACQRMMNAVAFAFEQMGYVIVNYMMSYVGRRAREVRSGPLSRWASC